MRQHYGRRASRILAIGVVGSAFVASGALAETYTRPLSHGGYGGYGGHGDCPSGWDTVRADDEDLEKYDSNDDNVVCVKDVSGRGNTGDGRNAKDNNNP